MRLIVIGVDPGAANTGFEVVRTMGEKRMAALDGGVIETRSGPVGGGAPLPDPRLALAAGRLARAEGDGAQGPLLRAQRGLGAERRPGPRGRPARRRPAPGPLLRLHPPGREEGGLRLGLADKGQVSEWSRPSSVCRSPPTPDHAADAFAVAICHAGEAATPPPSAASGRPRAGQHPGARRPPAPRRLAGHDQGIQERPRIEAMIASVGGGPRTRATVTSLSRPSGVGYRLAVSAETLKAVPARGKRHPIHSPGRPRRLAQPLRLPARASRYSFCC